VFTARYALIPYITICFIFKGLTSLVFITEVERVYRAVRTDALYNAMFRL